tara:strand:- start:25 stop:489 length:465 start_codon:yes stop_codon:yes gene_type:complete
MIKATFMLVLLFGFVSLHVYSAEYDFFKGEKTEIKEPFKLRDPFKRPLIRGEKKVISSIPNKVDENSYSNIPSISALSIEDLSIVGLMLGKNRRAIVKSKNAKETFIIKEGMELGDDKAIVKAIMPGGVVLVEKIKNVYDQFEYLETLLPITNE